MPGMEDFDDMIREEVYQKQREGGFDLDSFLSINQSRKLGQLDDRLHKQMMDIGKTTNHKEESR